MSTDPTGLGNEGCIAATSKKYVNIDLDRSLWCNNKHECLIDNLIADKELACLMCIYRKQLNIPAMIDQKMKEKLERE